MKDEARQRGRPRKPRPPGLSGQFGETVEQSRKDAGLSAEELGTLAGLGQGTVIRVERGEQSPTLDTVLAIAHALGQSGAELLAACSAWTERQKKKGKHHATPES
jgi:transcriptional regulator with XRE-family HTH domain